MRRMRKLGCAVAVLAFLLYAFVGVVWLVHRFDSATPAVWAFTNGIVTVVKSTDLNAASASNVPIEELHIAHEGLKRTQ